VTEHYWSPFQRFIKHLRKAKRFRKPLNSGSAYLGIQVNLASNIDLSEPELTIQPGAARLVNHINGNFRSWEPERWAEPWGFTGWKLHLNNLLEHKTRQHTKIL